MTQILNFITPYEAHSTQEFGRIYHIRHDERCRCYYVEANTTALVCDELNFHTVAEAQNYCENVENAFLLLNKLVDLGISLGDETGEPQPTERSLIHPEEITYVWCPTGQCAKLFVEYTQYLAKIYKVDGPSSLEDAPCQPTLFTWDGEGIFSPCATPWLRLLGIAPQ